MTLEQLEREKPTKLTVDEAAAIMQIHPQTLRIGLQRGQFALAQQYMVENWIGTERFIKHMKEG